MVKNKRADSNKHAFKIDNYRNIHESFEKQLKHEADDIKQTYDDILKMYEHKLESDELNFEYEKAFLQSKINKNYSETFNYWEKVLYIIMTLFITSIMNNTLKDYSYIGIEILFVCFIASMIIFGEKSIRKERREYIYYEMRMEVLYNIQKLNS